MISFKTQTITVLRPGTRSERGDTIPDWATATTHTVPGCCVQPDNGDEVTDRGRDAVVRRWKVLGPAGADVTSLDRVRWDGADYDVDGPIASWSSPSGALAHVEFVIQRVEG